MIFPRLWLDFGYGLSIVCSEESEPKLGTIFLDQQTLVFIVTRVLIGFLLIYI